MINLSSSVIGSVALQLPVPKDVTKYVDHQRDDEVNPFRIHVDHGLNRIVLSWVLQAEPTPLDCT
jgi:hypothetical protein